MLLRIVSASASQPFSDRVIEALDGDEAAFGERLVNERREMFGWLEPGTAGGLELLRRRTGLLRH